MYMHVQYIYIHIQCRIIQINQKVKITWLSFKSREKQNTKN